jgi:hypothetical protein
MVTVYIVKQDSTDVDSLIHLIQEKQIMKFLKFFTPIPVKPAGVSGPPYAMPSWT